MKLKYYLRGVGIGIVFATLVMTVSSFVHKNNISDEYIIKEARKLGMIMKEEQKESEGLWGDTQDVEDTEVLGSEDVPPETESTSEEVSESEKPTEFEKPTESEKPTETDSQSEKTPDEESDSGNITYATITIVRGDYARQVAEKLYAAGIIEDSEAFRKYMGTHGYAKNIRSGTYNIKKGASFEEICKIVAK